MPDIADFWERIGGRSPGSVGFDKRGGGRGVMKIGIGDNGDGTNALTSGTQIHSAIKEILGFTVVHEDGIKLKRTLPKAHPLCPWLYASSISDLVGMGRMTKVSTDPSLEAPSFDEAAFYPSQDLTIEFKPQMYPIIPDDKIDTGSITWTDSAGDTYSNETYAKEWLRYTDFETLPAGEYIVAQVGQFCFDVASGEKPGLPITVKNPAGQGLPAGHGQVRMWLPKTTLKVTWNEVPYEYIDFIDSTGARVDSWIVEGLGCINQNAWHGYGIGTLLYTGVGINRYPQIVPDYTYGNESTAFTPKKLCDITFLFQYLNVVLGKDAEGDVATPTSAVNANVVQKGHNLLPFAHFGGWYFAKTYITNFEGAAGRGVYPSFPFELLFANPGVT